MPALRANVFVHQMGDWGRGRTPELLQLRRRCRHPVRRNRPADGGDCRLRQSAGERTGPETMNMAGRRPAV